MMRTAPAGRTLRFITALSARLTCPKNKARPIRHPAQVPDRNGKIFYTSITSLSHINKVSGHEAAHGWRRCCPHRYHSGASALRTLRLRDCSRSSRSGQAAQAACYIVVILNFETIWFTIEIFRKAAIMSTSDMIRELCDKQNVSLSEVARQIGQSRQNLYKKLLRDTLTIDEIKQISNVLGVKFEQSFTLPSGEQLKIEN